MLIKLTVVIYPTIYVTQAIMLYAFNLDSWGWQLLLSKTGRKTMDLEIRFIHINFFEVQLTFNIILLSGVQHSGSTFYIHRVMITMTNLVTLCHNTKLLQYY